ncbi:hypothetical protein OPQ81_009443 [Rhizoctonia solani]|nr:hypothetical protein OPQ81_009443 [Rhizoctonia solani]
MDVPGSFSSVKTSSRTPSTQNQGSLNAATEPKAKSLNTTPPLSTLCGASTVYDFTGANIRLEVNNVVIKTHEYLISKFICLNKLVEKARLANPPSDPLPITITGSGELVSDFLNTFKILGTSSIERPTNFDLKTLVSAARIAATYEHPALRAFCMKRLEGLSLTSMERLQVGRALNLKPWEQCAYQELSEREQMITKEEALTLGIDAYWKVASAREKRYNEKPRDYTCEMLFACLILIHTLVMVVFGYANPSV